MRKTVSRALCFVLIVVPAAAAQSVQGRPTANVYKGSERGVVFGATIIDLALTVDRTAQQSLTAKPDTEAPARMTFTDANGADTSYDVLIRIKGQKGSRRPFEGKPAFKVKLAQGTRFFGLEHLTLNNMVQDPTMVREALGYRVYQAAGVMVPTAGYVRLTVNGQPYGLYLNLESPDAQFLQRHFGDHDGILYEGAYGVDLRPGDPPKFQLHEGADPERATLETLVRAVDAPGDGIFYGDSALVDTASFVHMMAAGVLLDDWDNYAASNNYRIYWHSAARRWFFIPTGIDQTFGGNSTTVFGAKGVLFQKCLASERCTQEYVAAVGDVAGRFERLNLTADMDTLVAAIGSASQDDPKKPYTTAEMMSARDAMRAFIARRPTDVRAALAPCMTNGRDGVGNDCEGVVAIHVGSNQCLEVVSRNAPVDAGRARLAPCHGGSRQRWHVVAKDEAFELAVDGNGNCLGIADDSMDDGATVQQSACSGTQGQLFSLRSRKEATPLIATHSGKCIAPTSTSPGGTDALVQAACTQDTAQTWRLQRSIYR
jgi:hypothetical protein